MSAKFDAARSKSCARSADVQGALQLAGPTHRSTFWATLGIVAWFSACEAPPANVPRYWYGDSLHAPAAPPGGSPGEETPSAANNEGAGGKTGGVGGAGGKAVDVDPPPAGSGGTTGTSMDARGGSADVMAPATGDASVPMGPAASCQAMVSVTTVTRNGDFSPRNVGVVWVADANNKFVKTLVIWAATRANYLKNWITATTAAGMARNKVDAVSGATASKHTTPHIATWNCTDTKMMPVPEGKYQLCMEMTEDNGTGVYRCVPFDHAGTAYSLMLPNAPNFTANTVTYAPAK
jgi:hypothetical protein